MKPSIAIRFDAALVFVVILAATCWAIGDSPLARTEPHRAMTAHEMLESGNWLVPQLYGQPYLRKPPLHYWVLAGGEWITGSRAEWVYRVPSAIAIALLAAAICVFSNRWFGRPAGLVAGLSALALLALWGQARSADVDAVNTLFGVLAALFIIDFHHRERFAGWTWLGIVASFAAALLTKGPACATVILGAVIGAAVVHRDAKRTAMTIAALLLGGAIFTVWGFAAMQQIQSRGMSMDLEGLEEVAGTLGATDLERIGRAILLPALILIYGLPMSLALVLCRSRETAAALDPDQRRLMRVIAMAIGISLGVGVLARIVNPRYMYIVLPLLCPLAGAISVVVQRSGAASRLYGRVRLILTVCVPVFAIVVIILTALLIWRMQASNVWIIAASGMAFAIAVATILRAKSSTLPRLCAAALVAAFLAAIPYSHFRNETRRRVGSFEAANIVKEQIPDGQAVISGDWVLSGPEVFLYGDVEVDYYREGLSKVDRLPHSGWVLFHQQEWNDWADRAELFDPVIELPTVQDKAILAYYHAPQEVSSGAQGPNTGNGSGIR